MLCTSGNRDRQIVCFIQSAKWQSRESIRGVVLGSTLKSLDSRFGYAALGLNRNVFVIRENASL